MQDWKQVWTETEMDEKLKKTDLILLILKDAENFDLKNLLSEIIYCYK